MDVGAFDQLPLPSAQVLELGPQVGAKGVGAFRAFAGAGQQAVVAVVLIEAADGVLAVLDLEPLAHVHILAGAAFLLEAVGEGAAVPEQLGVGILRMPHGELAEEGDLLAHGGGGQQRHGNGAVEVTLAGDDIAHVGQHAVSRAGHRAHAQLHGRPALGGYRLHVVGLKDPLVQQHESVYLLEQRRGQIVHLIAGQKELRARFQLRVVLGQNLVVLVDDDGQIDRDDLQAELFHQLALVENDGTEGLGPHSHLSDAHPGEFLHHAADGSKLAEALGKGVAFHGAGLNVAEGNVEPLQLAAHAEQAALAVGVAGAVRQEAGVDGRPDADGLAHAPGHLRGDLFVAEVGVDDEHRVHLFLIEPLDDLFRVRFAVHHIDGIDALEVNEADVLRSKVLLDVFHGRTAAFFRLFPVKDARTGSDVAAHGCQTNLHLIIQHGKALFPIYLDGVLGWYVYCRAFR